MRMPMPARIGAAEYFAVMARPDATAAASAASERPALSLERTIK
jgi:hypothetical protein